MAYDLVKDPGEEHPQPFDARQAAAMAETMRVAREPSLGASAPSDPTIPAGSYMGGAGGDGASVLSDEENSKLPSPYDRMDVLRRFDAACGLVGAGKAEAALAEFDSILRDDPSNLQAAFWRGRALESMKLFADAAAAYRSALDVGMRSPACVAKALYCSLKAIELATSAGSDATAEWTAAVAFLASARGRGPVDDASTYLLEVALYLTQGHENFEKASEILERAERAPGSDALRPRIEQAKAEIGARKR
jgi:tetratricopeptide (TPR) repeat protein